MVHIELARYKLLPGTEPNALAEVEAQIQAEVGPKHPGYLGRELFRAADGSYILLMRWENEQTSSTWNNTLFASQAGQKLGSLVDPQSISMEVITPVKP